MHRRTMVGISVWMVMAALCGWLGAGCQHASMAGGTSASGSEPLSGTVLDGVRVVPVIAQRYQFIPRRIVVNQGDQVRLELQSKDVTHGIALKEYKIDQPIPPGKTTMVAFTADKPGTFGFHCSVFCGMGHMKMRGELVVLPAAN